MLLLTKITAGRRVGIETVAVSLRWTTLRSIANILNATDSVGNWIRTITKSFVET
jgi:hypothetical protein